MTHKHEIIHLEQVQIIDSPIDIIVGRPDICKYDLLRKCHDTILLDTKLRNIDDPTYNDEDILSEILKNDLYELIESNFRKNVNDRVNKWKMLQQKNDPLTTSKTISGYA